MDVHELLRTKENAIARVREEIKALHIVAPLLAEPQEGAEGNGDSFAAAGAMNPAGEEEAAEGQVSSPSDDISLKPIPPKRNRLRDWLSLAVGQ